MAHLILSWKAISSLAEQTSIWTNPRLIQRLEKSDFLVSDLSILKAYNYAFQQSRQSFDYSVERLDLKIRRYLPAHQILPASGCSKSKLAEVKTKTSSEDFETIAICHSWERDLKYVYVDDEDRQLATLVLPADLLQSQYDLLEEA